MRDLNHDFKDCRHDRDGSYATQADRHASSIWSPTSCPRWAYVGLRPRLQAPARADADHTLAQRAARPGDDQEPDEADALAHEKIGKDDIVGRTDAAYGVRTGVCRQHLGARRLQGTARRHPHPLCPDVAALAGGLRPAPEASIKIVPAPADRGDTLVLKASWNKGGREIRIPIRTPEQRQLLDEAKALAKGKSLVAPGYATYRDYLQHFRYECGRVGIHAFHGHRHLYAQTRYEEMTGWQCPARGGPTSRQLTRQQKAIDREARETISHEMGHGREQITAVYLGR